MSSSEKTHTVYRLKKGDPKNTISPRTEPIPAPVRGEVLVRIKALALNYRDVAVLSNTYPFPVNDNVVPISDSAGIIETLGEDVDAFEVGDRVVIPFDAIRQYGEQQDWDHGHGAPVDGFLREYATVPANMVVKVPKACQLTNNELASLVCTGVTAWNSLFGTNRIRPGQTVLALGTGGVSMSVLILAKAFGCNVIVTSSSDEKLEVAKRYGADQTINYKTDSKWGEKAKEMTGGVGVDFVIENGGAGTIEQSLAALRMGGEIAVVGFLAKPSDELPDVAGGALAKGAIVRGINTGSKQFLEELVVFASARTLRIPIDKTFGLEDVLEAYEYLESAAHVGKVCIEL